MQLLGIVNACGQGHNSSDAMKDCSEATWQVVLATSFCVWFLVYEHVLHEGKWKSHCVLCCVQSLLDIFVVVWLFFFFWVWVDTLVFFRYCVMLYAVNLLAVNKPYLIQCTLKEVIVKGPLTRPHCKFWWYTGSCKVPSRKHCSEIISQISSLLEEMDEINCAVSIPPGG